MAQTASVRMRPDKCWCCGKHERECPCSQHGVCAACDQCGEHCDCEEPQLFGSFAEAAKAA